MLGIQFPVYVLSKVSKTTTALNEAVSVLMLESLNKLKNVWEDLRFLHSDNLMEAPNK